MAILEQAKLIPNCTVLFASSIATYGGELPELLTEAQPQWTSTLYGVSKVACERLGAYARDAYGLDFRCIRLPIVLSAQAPKNAVSATVSHAFVESAQTGRFLFRARPEIKIAALYVKDAINGMLVPVGDAKELADVLVAASRAPRNLQRLGMSALDSAREMTLKRHHQVRLQALEELFGGRGYSRPTT